MLPAGRCCSVHAPVAVLSLRCASRPSALCPSPCHSAAPETCPVWSVLTCFLAHGATFTHAIEWRAQPHAPCRAPPSGPPLCTHVDGARSWPLCAAAMVRRSMSKCSNFAGGKIKCPSVNMFAQEKCRRMSRQINVAPRAPGIARRRWRGAAFSEGPARPRAVHLVPAMPLPDLLTRLRGRHRAPRLRVAARAVRRRAAA
eukprot:1325160-Prymnesium_polylepis.1